jgi:hypothetical protein
MLSAPQKIAGQHRERLAVIYLRQSSPRQVRENFRSTERQYGLAEEAARLGWECERIVTVDGDLGISGRFSDAQARQGYKQLVSRVCLGGGRRDLRLGGLQAGPVECRDAAAA